MTCHVCFCVCFSPVLMPVSATAKLKMNLKPEADLSIPQVRQEAKLLMLLLHICTLLPKYKHVTCL